MLTDYLKIALLLSLGFIVYADTGSVNQPQQKLDGCGEHGDCLTILSDCKEKCGCDKSIPYIYNEVTRECILDLEALTASLIEKYNTEEKIKLEAESVFNGILMSVVFFISVAGISAFSVCIYCCHMNYSDYRLKKEVDALSDKFGKKTKNNETSKKPLLQPIQESCNVVVEDAGVFVV